MTDQPKIDCRCSGDAREMGLAQGQQVRGKIRGARESLRRLEAFRLEQPGWLPFPLFQKMAEVKAGRMMGPALQRLAPAAYERMQGIAAGAGLPLSSLCLMNAMEAFIGSMEGRTTMLPPLGACSALAVRSALSATGEPIIAKNFDYMPLLQPYYMMRESRPQGRYRSLEFAVAPQAGAVDGVNEKGLAITLNYAFVTDAGTPQPLITMLISEALAGCASVREAVQFITASPRWGAGMLMLADAEGDLASVELSNTRSGVRRPPPGTDWLHFTNVCHCAETCAVQVPAAAEYAPRTPAALRGSPVLQPHAERDGRIGQLVQQRSCLGVDDLAAIMADHGAAGTPDGTSPCVHTDYFQTTACLQWFPARRSVRVSYSTACTARYVELSL